MSGLTRSQLESWQPEQLLTLADSWRKTGASIESLFTRYVSAVTQVQGSYWEGVAAEAAQTRAGADKKTAIRVVDTLDDLASLSEQGYHAISAHVMAAKDAIREAESYQFSVSENFVVTDLVAGPQLDNSREAARASWQSVITDAALAAFNADLTTKDSLSGLRAGLIATFTDAAALSGQQGAGDGRQLAEHPENLSTEEQQRLKEAGSLTPEQLAQLNAGNTAAIPASQMEYINALSRSLDGKSPEEIKAAMDKMPPESRAAFANALQIGANNRVTASVVGDKDVPTNGGLAVLPREMSKSLTRDDLVRVTSTGRVAAPGSTRSHTQYELNGVADNNWIAEIAGAGDHRFQVGSELDQKLMDVGSKYLHAQVQAEQSAVATMTVDGHDVEPNRPVAENIFSQIGDDKSAVATAVSDSKSGMQLVNDIQTHNWSDDGKAVSQLFAFDKNDFDNPQTGQIMDAVARASSSNHAWATLSSIPGTDGKSVGELNPELLRTLSKSMSPYVADMAGAAQHPGFGADWADDGTSKYVGAANVFGLMNTDDEAGGLFDGAAYNQQVGLEHAYAADPEDADAGAKLLGAGRLQGLVDQGMYLEAKDEYGNEALQQAYERKEHAFDAASNLADLGLSHLPAGSDEASTALALGGESLKNALIGPAPDDSVNPNAPEPLGPRDNFNHWNILDGAGRLDPVVSKDYEWALKDDGSGTIRALRDMPQGKDAATVENALRSMFGRLNDDHDVQTLRNAYDDVVQYRRDDDK